MMKTRKKERDPQQWRTRESEEMTFGDQRLFVVTFSHLCSSLMPEQCALARLSLLTSLLPSLLRHLRLCCGWLVLFFFLLNKKQYIYAYTHKALAMQCYMLLVAICYFCNTFKQAMVKVVEVLGNFNNKLQLAINIYGNK